VPQGCAPRQRGARAPVRKWPHTLTGGAGLLFARVGLRSRAPRALARAPTRRHVHHRGRRPVVAEPADSQGAHAAQRSRPALLRPCTRHRLCPYLGPSLVLPQELDLYAHVCHAYDFPGIVSRHKNVDVIIIRCACAPLFLFAFLPRYSHTPLFSAARTRRVSMRGWSTRLFPALWSPSR
jgi:hypothetical protein